MPLNVPGTLTAAAHSATAFEGIEGIGLDGRKLQLEELMPKRPVEYLP